MSRITRKILEGVVVSDKMQKTIVVSVDRRAADPMYNKYVMKRKKYKAHDEEKKAHVGDKVRIIETRPISKDKNFALLEILK